MQRHLCVVLMLLSVALGTRVIGQTAGAGNPPRVAPAVALRNANVLDVRTGRVVTGATVVLEGGKIKSVGPGPAPPGARSFDLKGKYVVPGLIDAHTHLADLASARRALESGVTTVRSASVGSFRDVAIRDLVRAGALPGPDVVAAGLFVNPRLGPDDVLADAAALGPLMSGVETPEKLRQLVRINLAHGVDVIKTRATERAGLPDTDPRKQVFTDEDLRAIVEEAATKDVPVEVHAHGDEGAMAAVRAGVRSIEHGTYLSESTLKLMKERGTYFVPTYMTVVDLAEPGGDYDNPVLHIRGQHMLPRLREAVQRAHTMGVKVVTGADTSYGPNSLTRISQEVFAFGEMGLSPLASLQSATSVAAELLKLDRQTGALDVGLDADVIVVESNPLENLRVLQDPLLVLSNGWVALDRLEFGREP